jgi:hypothetical protein
LPACDTVFSFGAVFLPVFSNLDSFLQMCHQLMRNLCYSRKEKKKRKHWIPHLQILWSLAKWPLCLCIKQCETWEFTCKYTIAKAAGVSLNVLIMVSVYSHLLIIFHLFRSDGCMEKWRSQNVNYKMLGTIVSQKSVCVYPFLLRIHWCFGESRTRNPVEGRVLKKCRFWNWFQKLDPVLVWSLQTGTRIDGSNF